VNVGGFALPILHVSEVDATRSPAGVTRMTFSLERDCAYSWEGGDGARDAGALCFSKNSHTACDLVEERGGPREHRQTSKPESVGSAKNPRREKRNLTWC
jgi:hypothetical protein